MANQVDDRQVRWNYRGASARLYVLNGFNFWPGHCYQVEARMQGSKGSEEFVMQPDKFVMQPDKLVKRHACAWRFGTPFLLSLVYGGLSAVSSGSSQVSLSFLGLGLAGKTVALPLFLLGGAGVGVLASMLLYKYWECRASGRNQCPMLASLLGAGNGFLLGAGISALVSLSLLGSLGLVPAIALSMIVAAATLWGGRQAYSEEMSQPVGGADLTHVERDWGATSAD